jgi:hypothetical protein
MNASVTHEKECAWRMPVPVWRELMDHHWPNTAWITLERDVFDRLCEFKQRNALPTWEQTLNRLLDSVNSTPVPGAPAETLETILNP